MDIEEFRMKWGGSRDFARDLQSVLDHEIRKERAACANLAWEYMNGDKESPHGPARGIHDAIERREMPVRIKLETR